MRDAFQQTCVPFQHISATWSEPAATLFAPSGAIGRHHLEVASLLQRLCGSGDRAWMATRLMSEFGAVGLASARSGVGSSKQGGVRYGTRGMRQGFVRTDFSTEACSEISVDHSRVPSPWTQHTSTSADGWSDR